MFVLKLIILWYMWLWFQICKFQKQLWIDILSIHVNITKPDYFIDGR